MYTISLFLSIKYFFIKIISLLNHCVYTIVYNIYIIYNLPYGSNDDRVLIKIISILMFKKLNFAIRYKHKLKCFKSNPSIYIEQNFYRLMQPKPFVL